ncbi:succinylglutamate desuccinylase/aspartoacylase family protein [Paraburkholderia sp. CNPSo 3274]|uniref:M14 family metallopeptidase n=1 Tax=Paraburkholderia sp. CNPSo 3274 TaxID=2940932 RepID=UPI0020B8F40B|nr:succinylglutamate desuccinylase/aspartoacylase family protein [Paraburkholderia sp. CNPSo 3274]MCP3708456.1 succinylglutamate desuccinylase/aspartoacylase family protein [Paraburkholderia sp. CNPSo 3274]
MQNESEDVIARRAFMKKAVALVGATSALVTQSEAASAQGANAPAAGGGQGTGTVYTGDVIQGKKVISALDVGDLERGKTHKFYFQGVQMPTGQHWYVSVIVVHGARPGKRVALTSGVHGDEMSPVHTIHGVISQLDPGQMSGTVLAVLDVSRPALEAMERRWPNSALGIGLIDINREWPGNENGASAPSRHAGLLFNRLLRPNTDYALDFHTGTTGLDVTSFNLARMELPEARAMAELFPIKQIFDNPAYPTLLANAFINVGIPAITPEIGSARVFDFDMIPSFVEGTMNVLKRYNIVSGPMGRTGRDVGIFVGNSGHTVMSTHGGFVELLVKLNDKVNAGQKVAIQRNTFGEVVAEYTTEVAGEVTARRTDATAEPRIPLVMILYQSAVKENPEDFSE